MAYSRFLSKLSVILAITITIACVAKANPVCTLPQVIEPRASAPDGQPSLVQVDDFALALSWSPQHCNANAGGQHAHQCVHNSFEWVVHGLWPQSQFGKGKKGQPRNCKGALPALSEDLIRRHLCTLPGVRLLQDQWQKHGSCHWDTAEQYFAKIEEVFGRFKLPSASIFAPNGEVRVSALKAAIASANPGVLEPTNVVVFVSSTNTEQDSKNRLREIFICLNKQFQPMPCRTEGSTPDNVTVKVDLPRSDPLVQQVTPVIGQAAKSLIAEQTGGVDYCPKPQSKFSGYAKAVKTSFWGSLYADGGRTIYCDAAFEGRTTQGGLPINIEHAVPQSKLGGSGRARADLHNLWPSIERVNSARGNHALVHAIAEENWAFRQSPQSELKACDFELQTVMRPNGQRVTVVEPRPGARGHLARSILHMSMAYKLALSPEERTQYLIWHRTYPVTAEEEWRNDAIEKLQGTRNPLIDSPDNADVLLRSCLDPKP